MRARWLVGCSRWRVCGRLQDARRQPEVAHGCRGCRAWGRGHGVLGPQGPGLLVWDRHSGSRSTNKAGCAVPDPGMHALFGEVRIGVNGSTLRVPQPVVHWLDVLTDTCCYFVTLVMRGKVAC